MGNHSLKIVMPIDRSESFDAEMERRCKAIIASRAGEQELLATKRAEFYPDANSLNVQMARCLAGESMKWHRRLRLKRLWEPLTGWIERLPERIRVN
jgi:hypothetical protein